MSKNRKVDPSAPPCVLPSAMMCAVENFRSAVPVNRSMMASFWKCVSERILRLAGSRTAIVVYGEGVLTLSVTLRCSDVITRFLVLK